MCKPFSLPEYCSYKIIPPAIAPCRSDLFVRTKLFNKKISEFCGKHFTGIPGLSQSPGRLLVLLQQTLIFQKRLDLYNKIGWLLRVNMNPAMLLLNFFFDPTAEIDDDQFAGGQSVKVFIG